MRPFGVENPDSLRPAPAAFVEAVACAQASADRVLLWLLGEEIATLDWAVQGWREVGRAQLAIEHDGGARVTWTRVRDRRSEDDEATLALASLGHRLAQGPAEGSGRGRVVVFSGHRADAKDRPKPRFPAAQVTRVRTDIVSLLKQERALAGGRLDAIAGAASGGDILFQEACAALAIPSTVLLALPRDRYVAESVQDGGPDWVARFNTICERVPPVILGSSADVPPWMSEVRGYSIWQRNNLWTLSSALARDNTDVTLMLVWDGKGEGDGPGGTADMVRLARQRGVKVLDRIDPLNPTSGR